MDMAQAQSQSTDRTRDEPSSEKGRTIAEVAREMGEDASNPAVADEVEDRIGDRPDPSWVSRVRSKYAVHADPDDFDTDDGDDGGGASRSPPPEASTGSPSRSDVEDLMVRVDMIAGRLERFADNVDALEDLIVELEDRVEALEAAEPDVDQVRHDDLADTFEELSDRLRGDSD